jgi:predicted nucleotidyltransferase
MSTIKALEDLLERFRALKPHIKKQYRVNQIELFGSNIRGQQTESSDIDILVDFAEEADLFDLTGLAIFLEEELQRKVDVVPKRALREEIRESILKEAINV